MEKQSQLPEYFCTESGVASPVLIPGKLTQLVPGVHEKVTHT